MTHEYFFTSESVTEGHPDKISDQISDAVLDAILEQDPIGHVACETFVTTGLCIIGGELKTKAYVDVPKLARQVIKDIGYVDATYGFDGHTCGVITAIDEQSPDIDMGVSRKSEDEQGAGDQGMMFGYAVRETKELMPWTIDLAHELTWQLAEVRKKGLLRYLRPDGKSQVTIHYIDGKPDHVEAVVIAAQHSEDVSEGTLRDEIIREVVHKAIPPELIDEKTKYFINSTGRFVMGGPMADTGLTGRKIIVDTYGGHGAHGGGCFSGKDPSKVDRSASYMARYIAKNIVAAEIAEKCLVQLAYAIGVADPVSVFVECYGTCNIDPYKLETMVREIFPLRPARIIKHLDLLRPIYRETATYGHFGRFGTGKGFSWEKIDKVEELRLAAGLK